MQFKLPILIETFIPFILSYPKYTSLRISYTSLEVFRDIIRVKTIDDREESKRSLDFNFFVFFSFFALIWEMVGLFGKEGIT